MHTEKNQLLLLLSLIPFDSPPTITRPGRGGNSKSHRHVTPPANAIGPSQGVDHFKSQIALVT